MIEQLKGEAAAVTHGLPLSETNYQRISTQSKSLFKETSVNYERLSQRTSYSIFILEISRFR